MARNPDVSPRDIEPGDTLELERHPVYHDPSATPRYRVSNKRVKGIEWHGDWALITLHGMRSRYAGGVTIDTRFKLLGSDDRGWWVTKGAPRPSRYALLSVHKGRVRPNPIAPNIRPTQLSVPPPPMSASREDFYDWLNKTYSVGTPVKFVSAWGRGDMPEIPKGARGVVYGFPLGTTSSSDRSFLIPVEVTDARDPLGLPVSGLVGRQERVPWQHVDPLVDNWLARRRTSRPRGRHHLPRSQRSWMKPNARALGDRPAMETRFGRDLDDPDDVTGTEGKHLDQAMDRYETFHAKAPIRVAELDHDLPTSWVAVGDAVSVMYRTDKWKKDGNDEDYKHLHDAGENKRYPIRKGVRFFEPASEVSRSKVRGRRTSRGRSRSQRLPVGTPKALTLLGYCLGFFVRRDDDGEIYEVNPRGCYLFSSPSGNALFLYSPTKQSDGASGFLGAAAGGKLRVLKDGIDG